MPSKHIILESANTQRQLISLQPTFYRKTVAMLLAYTAADSKNRTNTKIRTHKIQNFACFQF